MKKLTFTKVQTNSSQVFYKSSEYLTKGFNRLMRAPYEYDAEKERKYLYEHAHSFVKDEGFNIICLSDAVTHAERIAFAAAQSSDGTCFRLDGQIEGVHTMMSYGGNIEMCWPDETYLRLIARHNGYSQNNVEII